MYLYSIFFKVVSLGEVTHFYQCFVKLLKAFVENIFYTYVSSFIAFAGTFSALVSHCLFRTILFT
jgi:hypothetical protein